MARHYSGNANSYPHRSGAPSFSSYDHDESILDSFLRLLNRLWVYCNGQGRAAVYILAMKAAYQLRRNLVARRLLSFPHLLVVFWVFILLWGERWVFSGKVQSCDWDHWENWPAGATPHHLILIADPQLIDPHSYPGRPWPINPITYTITDNYMRRSYKALQKELQPDTTMFLGDLFDGGREWKTAHDGFEEPEWMKGSRPKSEVKHAKAWNKKYGEDFWLREYGRFEGIFYENWALGGLVAGAWQRGKKIISSLPGNHDLGFGAGVKPAVRRRFSAYFGETNRVDVIGNHTFVSVDAVSLSAGTSPLKDTNDLTEIFEPVYEFLSEVRATKRRAVTRELKFLRGEVENLPWDHRVDNLEYDTNHAVPNNRLTLDLDGSGPDFPTILLSHVPLYRDPGTPCGPMREHWPPQKPPPGQTTPVFPDDRNALTVTGGYQYQNVLSEVDSIRLVKTIGNVIHAFSGDDHDYCEVVHSQQLDSVPEVTVKSLSMAMGVPTPGFQMVSLYNPVDENGKSLLPNGQPTLQTHLCLLPVQLSTFTTYAVFALLSIVVLIGRALLVPLLNLKPFALDSGPQMDSAALPLFKAKVEADPEESHGLESQTYGNSTSKFLSARTRGRGASVTSDIPTSVAPRTKSKQAKWGWGDARGPRIKIRRDLYDGDKTRGTYWQAAHRPNWRSTLRSQTRLVVNEIWTSLWRVVWMAVGFYAYLNYKG